MRVTPSRTIGALGTTARRRRQKLVVASLAALLGIAALMLALGAAYLAGTAQREREIERLEADVEAARAAAREATARAAAAEERAARLLERGQRTADAPRPAHPPDVEALVPLLAARLAEGVSRERLARAITSLPVRPVCDPNIEVRSLPVAVTPTRETGGRSIGGGRFTVVARGVPAKSPTGRTEAWFDPAQPVQLVIRRSGEEPRNATGVLPYTESLVIDRREYRFTARTGERRGTIELALQVCDYP